MVSLTALVLLPAALLAEAPSTRPAPIAVDQPLFAPAPRPCLAGPCAELGAPRAGRWTFKASGITWSIDVDAAGRFRAEARRTVLINGERADYRSTAEGRASARGLTLTVTADDFSLPNFVPGPPTLCTGQRITAITYAGRCSDGGGRSMDFTFEAN
jgi:hypothetical protein